MLVRDLFRLMESGDYKECLLQAVRLLEAGGQDGDGRARIQSAICRCKLELTDYFGAIEAGELACAELDENGLPDLAGFVLLDLARAHLEVRQFEQARGALLRFLQDLPQYLAARMGEGQALELLGQVLERSGLAVEASGRYLQAQRWYLRYGDVKRAARCVRSVMRIHLEQGSPDHAEAMLRESESYAAAHPDDREFLADHLLDRALYLFAVGRHDESIQSAFQVLELAEGLLQQQCRAHLMLCHNAMATNRPKDALNFAMAARVSAIDGRWYDLEFEASEILFRLLRDRGARMIRELEQDYYRQGVDIYHYLSERVVRRMMRET